jgi:ABC-type multidrug transport system permease subunit
MCKNSSMDFLVTVVSLLIGLLASLRRNEKIRRQIWDMERQTMTRFESMFRSLVYGLVVTVFASILISFLLTAVGIQI